MISFATHIEKSLKQVEQISNKEVVGAETARPSAGSRTWGMKKEPDEIDFDILRNVVRLCPGGKDSVRMREAYRPLLGERCDSFLWHRVMILAKEGLLKIERVAGRKVMLRPTTKARRLIENNGPKEADA